MNNSGEGSAPRYHSNKVSVACQTQNELASTTKDFGSNEPTTSQNNGKSSQSVTSPVASTRVEEGLLRLCIDNFQHMKDTMYSPSKVINGVPWRITVMPKQHTTGKKTQKCLAFFLKCCPTTTYNDKWTCQAIAEMRLLAQRRGGHNFIRKTTHVYNPKENDWGYSCFMTWAEILDESQGYIKNGTVIVEITVRAEPPKNMMTKDEFLLKLNQWYRLAENHLKNDRVDLAIEANQQAIDYCKDKNAEMAKQLKIQKDALVAQKLVESIKRLEDGSTPSPKKQQTEGRAAIRSAIAGPICTNEFCRLHKAKRQCTHLKKTMKNRASCKSTNEENHIEGSFCSASKIPKKTPIANSQDAAEKVGDEDLGAESEGSYDENGQTIDLGQVSQIQITTADSSCQTEESMLTNEAAEIDEDGAGCHHSSSEKNSITEDTASTQDEEVTGDEEIHEELSEEESLYKRPTTPELLDFRNRHILHATRKKRVKMVQSKKAKAMNCLLSTIKYGMHSQKVEKTDGLSENIEENEKGTPKKGPAGNKGNAFPDDYARFQYKWACDDMDTMVAMISAFKNELKSLDEKIDRERNTEISLPLVPVEEREQMTLFFSSHMATYQCDRVIRVMERFLAKSEQLFNGKKMTALLQRITCGKLIVNEEQVAELSSMDAESDSNDSLTTGLSERGEESDCGDIETCSENESNESSPCPDEAYKTELSEVAENLLTFNQSMFSAIGRFKDLGYALALLTKHIDSVLPEKINHCQHGDLQRLLEIKTRTLHSEQATHQAAKKKLEEFKAQATEAKARVEQLNKQLREKTNENKRLEKKSQKDETKLNELVHEKAEQEEKLKNQKRDANSLRIKHSEEVKAVKTERDQLLAEVEKLKREATYRESQMSKERGSLEAKLRQANAELRDWRTADARDKRALDDMTNALENAHMCLQESEINTMIARFEATINLHEHILADAQREVNELEAYASSLRTQSAREQECFSKLESSLIEWRTFIDVVTSTLVNLRDEASSKIELARNGSLEASKAELQVSKIHRPAIFRPVPSNPGVIGEQRNKGLGSPSAVSPIGQTTKKRIGAIGERPTATVAPQTVSENIDSFDNCLSNLGENLNESSSAALQDLDTWNPLEILARGPMHIPPVRWNGYPRISWLMPGSVIQSPVMQDVPNMDGGFTQLPPQQSSPAPMLPPVGYPLPRYPTMKETEKLTQSYIQR